MEEFNNMLRSIISRFINVDDPSRMIIAGSLIIGGLSFFGALLWFRKDGNKKLTTNDRGPALKESKKENNNNAAAQQLKSDNSSGGDGKQQQLRNVFSVKEKPNNTGTNGSNINKKKASSDRPFESSYYFAHNKHSTG